MLCGEDSKSYIISKDQSNPKRLRKSRKNVENLSLFFKPKYLGSIVV